MFTLTITPPAVAHLAPAAAHPAPDVLVDIPKEYTPTDADQATIPRIEKKTPWWRPTCDKMIFLTCGVLMAVGFAGFIVGLHRFFGNPKEHM